MRVLLAGPDFEENLSVRYLASSLQAEGHEPLLAVFNSAEDVEAVAEQAGDADIAGLSVCFQSRAQEFLTLARRIKQLHPESSLWQAGITLRARRSHCWSTILNSTSLSFTRERGRSWRLSLLRRI
jgi:hypothetical protein